MTTLIEEISKPEYASMTDIEVVEILAAKTHDETYSRCGSLRTLAGLLTPEEYGILRTMLDAFASQSPMVADMLVFLKMPGDEAGNGGGLDMGHPGTRLMLAQFVAAGLPQTVADKLIAYSTRTVQDWPGIMLQSVIEARRNANII